MASRFAIRDAIRRALVAGLVLPIVGATASAQAPDSDAVTERVTVTGSRIKRVDIEGATPVTVITREDIDDSGKISVAEVVRGLAFNTFGSSKPSSSGPLTEARVSLRGLGGQRTLVLLDGRRISGSPRFGGDATNLSTIPLAAVSRIEVLRDGASAIYGSDAIGGVVNIITRTDYEGMQLSVGMGRPTQTGGDEDSYSIVGGVSGARGNLTFAFENVRRDAWYLGDREFSEVALSSGGYPGTYRPFLRPDDPRNPTGGFLPVGAFADPRCPEQLGEPAFPDSELASFGTPDGQGICRYNYAAVASVEPDLDTKSLFVNANYAIGEDTALFARGTFSRIDAFSRYAATPGGYSMSADNPNNPTNPVDNPVNALGQPLPGQGVDSDGDGTADIDGPFDLGISYRNVPAGPRGTYADDLLMDYLAGLQGTMEYLGGMDWELGLQYSKQVSDAEDSGFGIASALQAQIDDGSLDVFAVNSDTGDIARGFDESFLAATAAGAGTSVRDSETRVAAGDFSLSFDAWQLSAGPVPVALGFEYRDEKYREQHDEQSNTGSFLGTATRLDTGGARAVKALFGETSIPFGSALSVNVAARWEDYNNFGTTFNPKISASFRLLDSLLLRASLGTGFRAPSITELYLSESPTFQRAIDTTSCAAAPNGDPETGRDLTDPSGRTLLPGNPCVNTFYDSFTGGNRDLAPEESTNWNLGLVWNPLDDLSIALDWYDIELEDTTGTPNSQVLLDEEFSLRQRGVAPERVRIGGLAGERVGRVVRGERDDRVLALNRRTDNIGKIETDGLDLEGSFGFALGRLGDFRTTAQWTWVNEYQLDEGDGNGLTDFRRTFDPDQRGTLGLDWALGDFAATLLWNYVDGDTLEDANGVTLSEIDDFDTWDLQISYATAWNGNVIVGARNLFDKDPPSSSSLGPPFYYANLHDVFGRVPYARYVQEF